MSHQSPQPSGLCLCPEWNRAVPRARRLLDSAERAQALWAAKKPCVLGHHCSSPELPGKLPLCSPGAAGFPGSARFLDESGRDDLVAGSSVWEYDDVTISLDTTRCFGDSEPDDSLLEASGGEEGNSPLSYSREEIQEILADGVESKRYLTRKSALSPDANGESDKDGSSCAGTSVTSEETSGELEITEEPKEPLSRSSSSVGWEELWDENAHLDENRPPSAQVTRMLFDLDIQELLSLSPIDADSADQPLEDSCLEEAKREAPEAITRSSDLEESSSEPVAGGRRNLAVDCLGNTPSSSRDVSDLGSDCLESSTSSWDLACDRSTAEESSAPALLGRPTPSGSRDRSEATESCFSRKSEDDEGESTEAEEPSNSVQPSDRAVGQTGHEETTSGKKPGKVIPVPQEEEERVKQGTRVSEAELEPKKMCVHPCEEN